MGLILVRKLAVHGGRYLAILDVLSVAHWPGDDGPFAMTCKAQNLEAELMAI